MSQTNSLAVTTFAEVKQMAVAVASSGMFGMKTPEQALTLMMLAQAEGLHPITAARDYDIISGRPSKKAEAMLRDFLKSGGHVKWHKLGDDGASATFTHPEGGEVVVDWDVKRATAAELWGKGMWKKYPRQMFRSRVVSEGVRTVYPLATGGLYVPEEVQDFAAKPGPIDVPNETPSAPTPAPTQPPPSQEAWDPPAESIDLGPGPTPRPDPIVEPGPITPAPAPVDAKAMVDGMRERVGPPSVTQISAMWSAAREAGWNTQQVTEYAQGRWGALPKDLPRQAFNELYEYVSKTPLAKG